MPGTRRSGRRPTPTALKKLRGARIRDRGKEPVGAVALPEMPAYLRDDALAMAAWEAFARTLVALKVLTAAHGPPLAVLAETWADLQRKHDEWALMGRKSVLVTEWKDAENITRHRIIANPLQRLYRAERALFLQICGEFGLTPASASKVMAHEGEADPAFDAFLAGARAHVLPFNATKR